MSISLSKPIALEGKWMAHHLLQCAQKRCRPPVAKNWRMRNLAPSLMGEQRTRRSWSLSWLLMQGATLETTGQLLPGYTHCWSPVLTAGRQSFYDATYIHTHLTVYTYELTFSSPKKTECESGWWSWCAVGCSYRHKSLWSNRSYENCESVHLFEISRNGSARVGGFAEALVVHDEQAALSEEQVWHPWNPATPPNRPTILPKCQTWPTF